MTELVQWEDGKKEWFEWEHSLSLSRHAANDLPLSEERVDGDKADENRALVLEAKLSAPEDTPNNEPPEGYWS